MATLHILKNFRPVLWVNLRYAVCVGEKRERFEEAETEKQIPEKSAARRSMP